MCFAGVVNGCYACAMPQSSRTGISVIGVDADDTLWQSEQFFHFTQGEFANLLKDYAEPENLAARLLETEQRNLRLYGFGIKGFVLSMIETAVDITHGKAPAQVISAIVKLGHEMLAHPIEPLPGVADTLELLCERHKLVMVTKGDLFDQERKLAESGLGELFSAVEIVSRKDASVYSRIFTAHGKGPEHAMMIGNSLKSDVIPALEAGAWGIFVPHPLTWAHEHAEAPANHPRFREIITFGELPKLIEKI
jgi:putative hydrolase of the HAD superfamily